MNEIKQWLYFYLNHFNHHFHYNCKNLLLLTHFEIKNISTFNNSIYTSKYGTRLFFQKPFFQIFVQKRSTNGLGAPGLHFFNFFIAFLTWPNLTRTNWPFSQFFHHLTTLSDNFFSEFLKMDMERRGAGGLNNWIFSCFPNLTQPNLLEDTTHSIFHHLTPPVGGGQYKFSKERFLKERPRPKEFPVKDVKIFDLLSIHLNYF